MITDTHAHYDDEAFDADRDELLSSLYSEGIGCVINVSASLKTVESTLALAEKYDFMYAAVGVHPDEVGAMDENSIAYLRSKAGDKKVRAIGEIGLDYHWETRPRSEQQKWFLEQMNLGRELDLPIIFHSRDAAEDTMKMVKEECARGGIRGVMHCYSYSIEQAREYFDMGLYFGIGGVVTFKNAKKLHAVVSEMPLERLLLETDCPYLAPEPNRGRRNSSKNLIYVADKIAQLKNITREEVISATEHNAKELFGL